MTDIKNISVPSPCSQSWDQRTPASNGRHCSHCSKTVTDFTAMTDNEIIKYLTSKTNVCGRIGEEQISIVNRRIQTDNLQAATWWKRAAIIIGLLGPVAIKTSAQAKSGIVNIPDSTKIVPKEGNIIGKVRIMPYPSHQYIIKGKVIGKDDGLPIPGAAVNLKGKGVQSTTDVNGNFSLENTADTTDVLTISFVGYVPQDLPLKQIDPYYTISLETQYTRCTALLGGIVIRKPSLPKRIWYKIKHIF